MANLFNGGNFLSWSRAVKLSLGAKNKIGFIDGRLKLATDDAIDDERWTRCDYMVRCWILN